MKNHQCSQRAIEFLKMALLETTAPDIPLVWPVHPRSKNRAEQFGLWQRLESITNLHLLEPVGYLDNVNLMNNARLVLTDSGGIQEETTALGVPCLTARVEISELIVPPVSLKLCHLFRS